MTQSGEKGTFARYSRRVTVWLVALAMLALLKGEIAAQTNDPVSQERGLVSVPSPPGSISGSERFQFHLRSSFGVEALVGPLPGSGIAQWRDAPPEWGQGMAGFGRRYVFRVGQNAAEQFIQLGAGAALGQDPRYFRSETKGFWRRTAHAVGTTFTAPTASGSRQPAFFRFVGAYGAAAISAPLYPGDHATWKNTLTSGSESLAFDVAYNLGVEFWPEIKGIFRR